MAEEAAESVSTKISSSVIKIMDSSVCDVLHWDLTHSPKYCGDAICGLE